jgi:hypothetical protein
MTHLEVETGVLIDPIRALLRRLTTINASDHPCRILDNVGDFSATPALVTLAPRGAVRGFTLFMHGGRSNSVASGSRLQPPALRMYSFQMGVRRDGRGYGVAAASSATGCAATTRVIRPQRRSAAHRVADQ